MPYFYEAGFLAVSVIKEIVGKIKVKGITVKYPLCLQSLRNWADFYTLFKVVRWQYQSTGTSSVHIICRATTEKANTKGYTQNHYRISKCNSKKCSSNPHAKARKRTQKNKTTKKIRKPKDKTHQRQSGALHNDKQVNPPETTKQSEMWMHQTTKPQHLKQKPIEVKEPANLQIQLETPAAPLPTTDSTTRKRIIKDTGKLNSTIIQQNLTDINRKSHPTRAKYTLFSSAYRAYFKYSQNIYQDRQYPGP